MFYNARSNYTKLKSQYIIHYFNPAFAIQSETCVQVSLLLFVCLGLYTRTFRN
jgi:hypothetical protein